MTDAARTAPVLVLGGTGKSGRRVAERLSARGAPIRIGSRVGEPPFDWEDRATWAGALCGVGSVYVSYHSDLASPGAADTVGALSELAVANGVRRLVLLSRRGVPEAERAENAVRASGAEVTILRSSRLSQSFSEGCLREPVLRGEVAVPLGEVPEPFVDANDIADVAVAALTQEHHGGELYELTGPRLLTYAEALGEIAEVLGREIRSLPVAAADRPTALAHLTDGVERALGRQPLDFADFTRRTAAIGAWNAPVGGHTGSD
jgi:uncharacterized protein YbjT (DUF2867 family)